MALVKEKEKAITIAGTKEQFLSLAYESLGEVMNKVGEYFIEKIKGIDAKLDEVATKRIEFYLAKANEAYNFSHDTQLSTEERSSYYDSWIEMDTKLTEYEKSYRKSKTIEKVVIAGVLGVCFVIKTVIDSKKK